LNESNSHKNTDKKYEEMPEKIQDYFHPCLKLMRDDDIPWDVVISYMFSNIEAAQRMTLYVGIRRKHKCHKDLVWRAIDRESLYRDEFRTFFKKVFGKNISKATEDILIPATEARNKIMHGFGATESEKKKAVSAIIDYCVQYNEEMSKIGGFQPFGSLQGAIGASTFLDKSTTKWVLTGMGFFKKSNDGNAASL